MQYICLYAIIYKNMQITNMHLYANIHMHVYAKNMQKYAKLNMHKYAFLKYAYYAEYIYLDMYYMPKYA